MAASTERAASVDATPAGSSDVVLVDPRAPRFGQSITAIGFASAVVFDLPLVLYGVTAVLVAAVVSGWQLDVYAQLWRRLVLPVVGPPDEREPAAPHRFARVLGALGGTVASVLVVAGVPILGYAVAAAVAGLAGLAAVTGICLGCRMYRQVALFRRLNVV